MWSDVGRFREIKTETCPSVLVSLTMVVRRGRKRHIGVWGRMNQSMCVGVGGVDHRRRTQTTSLQKFSRKD